MRILLTAGPTREPLDPVRYLGNRSSGRMGAALAQAALAAGHTVTAVLGAVETPFPAGIHRVNVETAAQMHDAVLRLLPECDVLIMAAAVADYRPKTTSPTKLSRSAGPLTLELEPTEDIAAAASAARRPDQRIIGFSLERDGDLPRARHKLSAKRLDLIVYNPLPTMGSPDVTATLIWPDGREQNLPLTDKHAFARRLIAEAERLTSTP